MDEKYIHEMLDKLRDGELHEYEVTKEQFMTLRKVLVSRPDFKHFKGIAMHGGKVRYQYLKEPRS
ncbi:hypothetical protein [Bacillus sp. FJAT-47783]|uniref:hypothetical protein n=1 Tax=Bacillus sp. FJAT-47783 TaxID=2922712 RepID=UPI001FABF947|nr:hypothetical protein [Bacillus sp. FJAT-47783]